MDGFKQRIIGAVIIVSLAVIFLPMMFDEPHQERTRENIDLPDQPDFPEVRVERSQSPAGDAAPEPVPAPQTRDTASPAQQPQSDRVEAEPAPEPEPAPQPERETRTETTADTQPPEQKAPDSAALEGSYLVQLGSFGSSDNARGLRDRVRETGVQAYVETFQREGNTLNRVFAGPFVSRDKAQQAKETLDQDFGLNTLIISAGDNG